MSDTGDSRIQELEREIARLLEEVAALRRKNEELVKELEEWKRGHRYRPRRYSSRPEARDPSIERKRPGRKPGHPGAFRPVPETSDRTDDRTLTLCPDCQTPMDDTGKVEEVVVEDIIPARKEVVRYLCHVYDCPKCRRRQKARPPAELGPQPKTGMGVQSMVVSLRHEFHMPFHAITRWFARHADIKLTPGGVAQMVARLGKRSLPAIREIEAHIRKSPFVHIDETGWHEDGDLMWTWLAATPEASLFRIEGTRGRVVVFAILGEDFCGFVISDFLSVYTGDDPWWHQFCWAHLIRESKKVAEISPGRATTRFRDRLTGIYQKGLLAAGAKPCEEPRQGPRHGVRVALGRLVADEKLGRHRDVARLQERVDIHFNGLLHFLDEPGLPADNNRAERDLRPLVVLRKMAGGTRSPAGSKTIETWESICRTLDKQGMPLNTWLPAMQSAYHSGSSPPSVFSSH
ncbi:MAG: IS66 family transposase [Deltaproteobacteria bacterium]|nr:IS66 family transposase [Deltaproteobacteria bacterium]